MNMHVIPVHFKCCLYRGFSFTVLCKMPAFLENCNWKNCLLLLLDPVVALSHLSILWLGAVASAVSPILIVGPFLAKGFFLCGALDKNVGLPWWRSG